MTRPSTNNNEDNHQQGEPLVVAAEDCVAIEQHEEQQQQQQQPQNRLRSEPQPRRRTTQEVQQHQQPSDHTTTTTTNNDNNNTNNSNALVDSVEYIEPDFVRRIHVPVKPEEADSSESSSSEDPDSSSTPVPHRLMSSSSQQQQQPHDVVNEVRSSSSLPDLLEKEEHEETLLKTAVTDKSSTDKTMDSTETTSEDDEAMLHTSTLIPDSVNYKEQGENLSYFGAQPSSGGGTGTTAPSTSSAAAAARANYQYEDPVPVAVAIHDASDSMMHQRRASDNNDINDPPIVMLEQAADEETGGIMSPKDLEKLEEQRKRRRRQTTIGFLCIVVLLLAATATAVGVAVTNSRANESDNRAGGEDGGGVTKPGETTPIFVYSSPPTPAPAPTFTGPECATVRCGTSWVDANTKCGAQCLTQECPDGEACWADVDPQLACCPLTENAQQPYFNPNQAESTCSAMRCGTTWEDANDKCGETCEPLSCPSGQLCYSGLDTTLNMTSPDGTTTTSTTTCLSESRCGTSFANANSKCGDSCLRPTCPDGETCFADLSTTTLECCFPPKEDDDAQDEQEPTKMKCTTTRCGLTWANANNYCLPNCVDDSDCTGEMQRCYADLKTSLDCCEPLTVCTSSRCGFTRFLTNQECGDNCVSDDDCAAGQLCFHGVDTSMDCCDVVEDVPDPYTCTATRCGLDWGAANTNCGPNCVSDADCPADAPSCFADLETRLDCCPRDESVNNTDNSTAVQEPQQPNDDPNDEAGGENVAPDELVDCTTTRCGLDWVSANSNCGTNCVSNEDCTVAGHSCFADLTMALNCCAAPQGADDNNETTPSSLEVCTTTRCGLDWVAANSNCGANCLDDADCTEAGQACFADLTTALDCCPEEQEEDGGDNGDDTNDSANVPLLDCTTTRCGLSWGAANTNCGANCLSNEDCTEAGHTCFADLTTALDCCANAPLLDCTTTRCGLSWGAANTNCGANCLSNEDCTEAGHTCFADLTTTLDCCA